MHISVTSSREGTDYCLHNPPLTAYAHNTREASAFFVLRANNKDTKVTARLFFTRTEFEQLQAQISHALAQNPQPAPGINAEKDAT